MHPNHDGFWTRQHEFFLRNLEAHRKYSWLREHPDYWKRWSRNMHECKRCLKHINATPLVEVFRNQIK